MTERKRKRGFSARFVETVKPGTRTKLYCDDNGLYLAVQPSGSRQWVQRLVIRGRRRELGLGGFPLVSLAEAREAAFHNRKLARQGGDPLAHKRKSEMPTFEEAARTVITLHRSSWRNAKHAAQWDSTLREYAFPRLGKRPVSDIDTKDVMAALLPIWTEKPETAKRVRQRIGTIMKWAIAQGHRTDNPAGEALGAALPKTDNGKRHHAALPHAKVADAIAAVRGSGAGMAVKLAFEFLVLTAARSGEVRLATWDEIDTDARTWTVPAERMKANQEHRVPLCARAMQILAEARALETASGLVFPGTRASKPLADLTLSKLMRDLNIDAALAHTVRNKVEAAYNRTDRTAPTGKKDDYTPVIPVPEDAPAPDWDKLRPQEATGDPVKISTYHTAEGGVAFYVARWLPKDPDDDKVIRPATWDGSKWRLKGMPAPRPLYRLPDIPKSAGPVVVVEGEKCADGAHDAFAFQLVTTWSGGCRALNRTNWQPLAGREVLLVADADDPGRKAMEALAQHLHSLGCKVRIYLPEGDDGNDIADWIEADDAGTARERIDGGAKPWPPMDWKDELVERAKTDPGAPFEQDTVVKLAGLRRDNPPEWQRLRRELRKAKILIGDLEPAMADVAREDGDSLQGQPLHWDEVEPCPDPVDGAALLDELVELIRKHASLPDGGAEAVVLWALYAWCFRAFGVCPNLMITAPERESGKTCVTELLSWMVPRPKPVSDASAAAIIRTIEHACPTLLFDEAQHFLRRRPEDPIRGILLASFVKRFASVDRCDGEMNEPRVFSTFTPKAMNGRNLANLDDMLTSRSVVIPMTRATKRYPHIRPDRDPVGCGITGKCARWRDDHSSTLADADPDMGHLWGRIADVWRPLFAIADAAGGEWPALARQAATNLPALTATVADGETLGVQLLEDIYQVFKDKGNPDEISTADLDRELNEMSERPWPTLNNGKPMTAQKRGRLLSPYGIRTETLRFSGHPAKGYRRTAFCEAWDAYLSQKAISEPLHRCNPHLPTDSGDAEPLQRRTGATVSDPPNSVLTNDCNGATVHKPEGAGESSADAEDSATSTGHDGGPSRNEVPRLDEQDPDYPTTL